MVQMDHQKPAEPSEDMTLEGLLADAPWSPQPDLSPRQRAAADREARRRLSASARPDSDMGTWGPIVRDQPRSTLRSPDSDREAPANRSRESGMELDGQQEPGQVPCEAEGPAEPAMAALLAEIDELHEIIRHQRDELLAKQGEINRLTAEVDQLRADLQAARSGLSLS